MGPSSSIDPSRLVVIAAAAALALGSCAEMNTLADVAFPQTVPGLPADQAWMSLPVRRWLSERGIEAVAISACLAETCPEPAVVGLFRARGRDAVALRRAAHDPGSLLAALTRGHQSERRPAGGLQRPRSTTVVERAVESGRPGLSVRLARRDGSRGAAGFVVALERRGGVTEALVVVSGSEAGARSLARRIIPRLEG